MSEYPPKHIRLSFDHESTKSITDGRSRLPFLLPVAVAVVVRSAALAASIEQGMAEQQQRVVHVIYITQKGTAKDIAELLVDKAPEKRWTAQLHACEDFNKSVRIRRGNRRGRSGSHVHVSRACVSACGFGGWRAQFDLPSLPVVLFVASTTGEGDVPDHGIKFWRYLRRDLPEQALARVHFAVLGTCVAPPP